MYSQQGRLTRKVNPGHTGWIWFVQCPGLICLAARWSDPATSTRCFSSFLDHILPSSKSAGFVSLSGKASLVSISAAILFLRSWHVYFPLELKISWKTLCWMRACRRKWHLVSPTLYIIIVYRVNLNKLSRNFVGALRTTTTNCRVSFIDLYLVFPTNFRIVFLPHTNNVILLEPHCGTITEPGRLLCPHRKMRTNKKILAVPEIPILQFSPIPIDAHIYQFTTP